MKYRQRWLRITVGILFPLVCAASLWYVYHHGSPGICVFHRLTNLYCPGCGSGRALYALLHLRFREAFQYNCLFIPLGLPAALLVVYEYLRFVFPRLHLRPVRIPFAVAAGCVALLFLFAILRNIPIFRFLAP